MSRESDKFRASEQPLIKPKGWWGIVLALPAVIAAGLLAVDKIQQIQDLSSTPTYINTPVTNSINALGRLEPQGEVIKLSSAPRSQLQTPLLVEQILVKEGSRVRKGQIIAILNSFSSNQAALAEAKAKLQEARANLANVKAASPRNTQAQKAVIARLQAQLRGERVAQQATIYRIQAELQGQKKTSQATIARVAAEGRNAQADAQRYEYLYKEGAISQQELDKRRLSAETTNEQLVESQATRTQAIATLQQQLAEAHANRVKTIATLQQQIDEETAKLSRIQEVSPSDVQIAQAKVSNAIASVIKAESELKLSSVVAPIAGEILKIHTKSGEAISPNGIAEIARTDQMIVIAEVPEDSISQVRLGQPVNITSDNQAFSGTLKGTVSEIGRKIGKQDVLNTDPAADVDARVVEVKIALTPKDSKRVSGLTNAKVIVDIEI